MDETLVTVAMFADVLPAELAKAQLEAEGIAAVVDEGAEHQLWGYALGVVRLKVRESQRDRASELLDVAARKPNAQVVACSREGDVTRVVLKFDMLPSEPAAPATLYPPAEDSDERFDLHRIIEAVPDALTFETYGVDVQPQVGATYVFCRWWDQDQLDLVKNESIVWRRERFERSDAVEYEQCGLCWQEISTAGADSGFGYMDGVHWVCERCYDKYIASGFRKKLG
ncbi:MAG TPA: DUF2007 domain-containing protein [Sedimentisphaerales bacterium]|nr:DUF2007 domain-containing protein [Sedimentisphaerales bacterium]